MAYQLSEENQARVKKIASRYPHSMSAILPALHIVMAERGWVDKEACSHLADLLKIPPVSVYDALSFYSYFPQAPTGKYHMQVCRNISCYLNGAENLVDHLAEKHNVRLGEVTDDGLFSITTVECLGACGGSPVIQVNGEYYENLTAKKIDELVGRWKMLASRETRAEVSKA